MSRNLDPTSVYCVGLPRASYEPGDACPAPELPEGHTTSPVVLALRELLFRAGLDAAGFGSPEWNPLGEVVPRGACVLVKPNWVSHVNRSGAGFDCLVTHASVVDAVLLYLARARPRRVVVGDAPVQGCDFEALCDRLSIHEILERHRASFQELLLRDFRAAVLPGGRFWDLARPTERTDSDYIVFDLGRDSLLEPLTNGNEEFRVTMFDPTQMRGAHGPGVHRYLIAREAIEADVVINLPKLKTHRKACVTGALKNMIGINGSKDFLPHHRKGAATRGGDCYERPSYLKALAEELLDSGNRARRSGAKRLFGTAALAARAVAGVLGSGGDLEGSWHGNDTIWRTSLDIQRIVHYGRRDGSLADVPQRIVLHVTDAVIAGEGEGPFAPTPVPLGIMTLGANACAVEWAHSHLMRLDPRRIPIVRESFSRFRHALVDFGPDAVRIVAGGAVYSPLDAMERLGRPFKPPRGWEGKCESSVGVLAEG